VLKISRSDWANLREFKHENEKRTLQEADAEKRGLENWVGYYEICAAI